LQEPDLKRVTIVDAAGMPFDAPQLRAGAQIIFDRIDHVPADQLLPTVLELIQPAPFDFEDRKRQTDWGATGLFLQDLLVRYGATVAGGVTVQAIVAGVRKLSRRKDTREEAERSLAKRVPQATTAAGAWAIFSQFMRTAFRLTDVRSTEITDTGTAWHIRAVGDDCRYEGSVSKNGRIAEAHQVEVQAPASSWATQRDRSG
jgi:hypothetical protein